MKSIICVLLIIFSNAVFALHDDESESHMHEQEPSFKAWLAAFKQEAIVKGISRKTLEDTLNQVKLLNRVIELDRDQPEFKLTFEQYLSRVAPPFRVNRGKKLLYKYRTLLKNIHKEFGVQPRFIVALWGMETDFGRLTGGFNAINALATLAFDGRRSKFFRGELLNALKIIDQGHISAAKMKGSWAGAMGQTQFMPSTFLKYAVDFDKNGRINVWNDTPDALASGANYLSQVGWQTTQTWGREVQVPANIDLALLELDVKKKIADWQDLGVRKIDGSDLPAADIDASVVKLDNKEGRAFMVYDNYRAIMDWNKSKNFATAVGILADRIGGIDK